MQAETPVKRTTLSSSLTSTSRRKAAGTSSPPRNTKNLEDYLSTDIRTEAVIASLNSLLEKEPQLSNEIQELRTKEDKMIDIKRFNSRNKHQSLQVLVQFTKNILNQGKPESGSDSSFYRTAKNWALLLTYLTDVGIRAELDQLISESADEAEDRQMEIWDLTNSTDVLSSKTKINYFYYVNTQRWKMNMHYIAWLSDVQTEGSL